VNNFYAFPNLQTTFKMDCGPSCLKIVLTYYKINYSIHQIREYFDDLNKGTSLLQISSVAERLGFKAQGLNLNIEALKKTKFPCIAFWNQKHFVVVYKFANGKVHISDPASGLLISYTEKEFISHWTGKDDLTSPGYILTFEPTEKSTHLKKENRKKYRQFIVDNYLRPFRLYFYLVALGMTIGLLLSLITPFLTKAIVDIGIKEKDIPFINLILLAQLITAISTVTLNATRTWIFLHMGVRMNISVVSRFLTQIMRLPVSFFDANQTGDVMQRINDHTTIKTFISAATFNMLFSFFNLVIFGGILAYYNLEIFVIFLFFSALYTGWVLYFMKSRKVYDYKLFEKNAQSQNSLLQIIGGIRDIKLNNSEQKKNDEWIDIQVESFKINKLQMMTGQYQQVGSYAIDLIKNILISYVTAKLVINGQMTLGMMLSVQYILGQLNIPITQFVTFSNSLQDARTSVERISEIYDRKREDESSDAVSDVQAGGDIAFKDVVFYYSKNDQSPTLKNLNFTIPKGKTTAIIGTSGSGKSTIIKLLLKFHHPYSGSIMTGNMPLSGIESSKWRSQCAAVMQDGFIFTESVAKNISFGAEVINKESIVRVARLANLHDHIMTLPEGYETMLGTEVNNFSQGQRQRLLIARALYKDSDFLFLDEPTNALDINNEKLIMDNIFNSCKGKTIVVVAHRLKTVQKADQILVMENGRIVEAGDHSSLLLQKGLYCELVNNT
jgi:ATP-binding cassette subfamily B protein